MSEFTRNDYTILRTIRKKKAFNELFACTIIAIQEETNLSSVKIRATLKRFINEGYIAYGVKKINAKTVYILPKGREKLEELIGGESDVKQE